MHIWDQVGVVVDGGSVEAHELRVGILEQRLELGSLLHVVLVCLFV